MMMTTTTTVVKKEAALDAVRARVEAAAAEKEAEMRATRERIAHNHICGYENQVRAIIDYNEWDSWDLEKMANALLNAAR